MCCYPLTKKQMRVRILFGKVQRKTVGKWRTLCLGYIRGSSVAAEALAVADSTIVLSSF